MKFCEVSRIEQHRTQFNLDFQLTLEDDALPYFLIYFYPSLVGLLNLKKGRLSNEDDPHSGRHSTSVKEEKFKKVEKLALKHRTITIKHLAEI